MAGTLLPMPVLRAVDANGAPLAGAQLQFYVTGTTTPTNVYTSSSLGTPLSNPVVADSGGLFVPIFLDPTVTYRVQLLTASGSVIRDIDPVSAGIVEATQTQVNTGTATGVYVSPAKLAAWTGVATALGYTPANKAGDTLTNALLSFTSLSANSAGYLGLPVNEQDASYTTALSDAGKMVRANSGSGIAYTVPPVASVAYPVGTAIAFRNVGAGVVTLTPGSGVSFYKAGATTTSSTVALAQGGLCTAIMEASNVWVLSGVGMT
jgi:hypothetical protein